MVEAGSIVRKKQNGCRIFEGNDDYNAKEPTFRTETVVFTSPRRETLRDLTKDQTIDVRCETHLLNELPISGTPRQCLAGQPSIRKRQNSTTYQFTFIGLYKGGF